MAQASKDKAGAREMYVTYELQQRTLGGSTVVYPKVKRVYIAGKVKDWGTRTFTRRSGRTVRGVLVHYEQSRRGYTRKGYTATRGAVSYEVGATSRPPTTKSGAVVIEVPDDARNVRFHTGQLPARYLPALQNLR